MTLDLLHRRYADPGWVLALEIPEAIQVLDYIRRQDMREKMFLRWIAPVYSPQSEMSLDEFIGDNAGSAKTESSGEIISRMDRIMEGR